MGQILLPKDFSPASFRSVGGTVTGSIKVPVLSIPIGTANIPYYAIPLGAAVPVAFQIQAGRIHEELAATAQLFVGLLLRTASTNTPVQFSAQCMAFGDGDPGLGTLGNVVNGPAVNTPGTASQWQYYEIEIPTGAYRNNLQFGDNLDVVLSLLWNAARAGNANDLLIAAGDLRLQLPDSP